MVKIAHFADLHLDRAFAWAGAAAASGRRRRHAQGTRGASEGGSRTGGAAFERDGQRLGRRTVETRGRGSRADARCGSEGVGWFGERPRRVPRRIETSRDDASCSGRTRVSIGSGRGGTGSGPITRPDTRDHDSLSRAGGRAHPSGLGADPESRRSQEARRRNRRSLHRLPSRSEDAGRRSVRWPKALAVGSRSVARYGRTDLPAASSHLGGTPRRYGRAVSADPRRSDGVERYGPTRCGAGCASCDRRGSTGRPLHP